MCWVWAILLLVLGLGLAVMEVFFPSAGILGFLAASAILAAIIMGFQQGPLTGFGILGLAVFGIPTILVLAFRYWPRTAMGRRILLTAPSSEDVLPDDPDRRHLRSLIGQIGRTKCTMLPAGAIIIDGRTVDAISEGMAIEAGQAVRVVQVRANRVVVRPIDEETPSS
jgi:membrane-bound serine protease (ClpP class)